MEIATTATILNIYYCENCKSIVATTDLSRAIHGESLDCPFCFTDSLVLLPKEDYQQNFDLNLFPYPQNIILKRFFDYADNTLQLLTQFSSLGVLSLLGPQISVIPQLIHYHILIQHNLMISVKLEIDEESVLNIVGKEPANTEFFETPI